MSRRHDHLVQPRLDRHGNVIYPIDRGPKVNTGGRSTTTIPPITRLLDTITSHMPLRFPVARQFPSRPHRPTGRGVPAVPPGSFTQVHYPSPARNYLPAGSRTNPNMQVNPPRLGMNCDSQHFSGQLHLQGLSLLKYRQGEGCLVDLSVLVPGRNAGSVIGKSGANIHRLRSAYQVSVTFTASATPDRILNIAGVLGSVCAAVYDVIPAILGLTSSDAMTSDGVRMLVHDSQAAVVVGKRGQHIVRLHEESGAVVFVFPLCCPQSTDRVAQISGHPLTIANCIGSVLTLLIQAKPIGYFLPYNPCNFDDSKASEYGGYTTTEMSNVPPPKLPFGIRPASFQPRAAGATMFTPPNAVRAAGSNPGPVLASGLRSFQINVPKHLVVGIFGHRGVGVKYLRKESKASIILEVPPSGAMERLVTLKGTVEQVQKAQYLIQMRFLEYLCPGVKSFDDIKSIELPSPRQRPKREHNKHGSSWMTEEILTQKRLKRKMERIYRSKPTDDNRAALKREALKMHKMCREAKDEYFSERALGDDPSPSKRIKTDDGTALDVENGSEDSDASSTAEEESEEIELREIDEIPRLPPPETTVEVKEELTHEEENYANYLHI